MVDASLQEIICCIGHPVAGNPTQYVMERAFAEANLDCRCLTLDVVPEQLPAAIAGLRAMDFRGAIIAPPYETDVAPFLDPAADGLQSFVDLIHCDEGVLHGDFVLGRVLRSAILTAMEWESWPEGRTALVLGDSPRALAIAEGLAELGTATTVLPTEPVKRPPDEASADADGGPPIDGVRFATWDDFEAAGIGADIVVQTEDIALPAWEHDGHATSLAVDLNHETIRTDFLKAAHNAGCRYVDGVTIRLQTLMQAFAKWTGAEADEQTMREALEEFLLI